MKKIRRSYLRLKRDEVQDEGLCESVVRSITITWNGNPLRTQPTNSSNDVSRQRRSDFARTNCDRIDLVDLGTTGTLMDRSKESNSFIIDFARR